jgi:hypothetical protein
MAAHCGARRGPLDRRSPGRTSALAAHYGVAGQGIVDTRSRRVSGHGRAGRVRAVCPAHRAHGRQGGQLPNGYAGLSTTSFACPRRRPHLLPAWPVERVAGQAVTGSSRVRAFAAIWSELPPPCTDEQVGHAASATARGAACGRCLARTRGAGRQPPSPTFIADAPCSAGAPAPPIVTSRREGGRRQARRYGAAIIEALRAGELDPPPTELIWALRPPRRGRVRRLRRRTAATPIAALRRLAVRPRSRRPLVALG